MKLPIYGRRVFVTSLEIPTCGRRLSARRVLLTPMALLLVRLFLPLLFLVLFMVAPFPPDGFS